MQRTYFLFLPSSQELGGIKQQIDSIKAEWGDFSVAVSAITIDLRNNFTLNIGQTLQEVISSLYQIACIEIDVSECRDNQTRALSQQVE